MENGLVISFLKLVNVVITPHIGGNTRETVERQSSMIVGDLIRFLDGDKPLHLLNPEIYEKESYKSMK